MKYLHVDYRALHAVAPILQIHCLQRAAGFPSTGVPDFATIGFPGSGFMRVQGGAIWMQQDGDGLGVQFVFMEEWMLQFCKMPASELAA